MENTATTKTYQVNLHHRGGFIRTSKVEATSKKAAEQYVRDSYPAKVIAKIVVL